MSSTYRYDTATNTFTPAITAKNINFNPLEFHRVKKENKLNNDQIVAIVVFCGSLEDAEKELKAFRGAKKSNGLFENDPKAYCELVIALQKKGLTLVKTSP